MPPTMVDVPASQEPPEPERPDTEGKVVVINKSCFSFLSHKLVCGICFVQ